MRSRRPTRLLLATSLSLSVVTGVIWVRSYFVCDGQPPWRMGSGWIVESWWGRVCIGHLTLTPESSITFIRCEFADVEGHRFPRSPEWNTRLNAIVGEFQSPHVVCTLGRFEMPGLSWRNGFGLNYDWTRYAASPPAPGVRLEVWTVPWWLVTLVVSLPWATEVPRGLRSRWAKAQVRCRSCGYDLRATPDRCPECGEPAIQISKSC